MGAAENAAPSRQDGVGGRGAVPAPESVEKVVIVDQEPPPPMARLQAQRPPAPLQVTTRAPPPPMSVASGAVEPPPQVAAYQPVPPGPQQGPLPTLNSHKYTNGITLFLFLLHLAAAGFAIGFFVFKTVQDITQHPRSRNARRSRSLLHDWLLPVEGTVALSIVLAFAWQKAVRAWPRAMVPVILWSSFGVTLGVGALLMCFSMLATVGLGVAMVVFSIGTGLYACWVTRRVGFTAQVFERAVQPVNKFRGLNGPAYLMVAAGFVWISVWCVAVIGAINFRFPGLTILALVVSLMWTAEVMRKRGEPDGEPGDRALLPARHAVERQVQLSAGADLQPRQRLPRLPLRAYHRGAAHRGAWAQPPGGRGRVHVLLRALLPPCHERHLQLRQQLGLRPYRGVRTGVRAGVAEHVGPVRGAAGDGGAGGLGHHELGVLPDGRDQRRAVRGAGGFLGVRHAPALHGHRVAAGLLRRVPDDPHRHGAAAGVRGVLLRVLRREPRVAAVRQHHPGAAAQDAGGPRPARAHAAVPAPARLTPPPRSSNPPCLFSWPARASG